MRKRSIVIVGGGIGGLTLARFAARDGHRVTVIERAKDFSAQGHSIGFRGVGLQVMQELGLRERVEQTGRDYRRNRSFTMKGWALRTTEYADHAKAVGGNTTTQRGLLHAALHEDLPAQIDLRFGLRPLAVRQTEQAVTLDLSDGASIEADIVVGADGANSAIRRFCMPQIEALDFGGVYAGLTIRTDHGLPVDEASTYWGTARLVAFFPVDAQSVAVVIYQDDAYGPTPADNAAETWAAYLKRTFVGAAEPVRRILGAMKPGDDVYHDRIYQVPAVQAAAGRVALVGDAGYCPTFLSGNGSAIAAVGAYALARRLQASDDDIAALKDYENRILPFVAEYQSVGQRMRQTLFARSPLTVAFRGLAMRYMPASVFQRNQRRNYRGEAKLSDVA